MSHVQFLAMDNTSTSSILDKCAEKILWLTYFNNKMLSEGRITKEEHRKIQQKISKIDASRLS